MARVEVTNAWGEGIDMRSLTDPNGPGYWLVPGLPFYGESIDSDTMIMRPRTEYEWRDNFDAIKANYTDWMNAYEGLLSVYDIYYIQGLSIVFRIEGLDYSTHEYEFAHTTWNLHPFYADDEFYGNDFSDYIASGDGNDFVAGNGGDDEIRAGTGNDVVQGGLGNDILTGEAGEDTLTGGNGNDTIWGGSGRDKMDGGLGDDTYYLDNKADTVIDAGGKDTIYTHWDVTESEGTENIIHYEGQSRHWIAFGSKIDNYIEGGFGNDRIEGRGGSDTLKGGGGFDTLIGGAGDDVVVYANARSNYNIRNNADGSTTVAVKTDVWDNERTDVLWDIETIQFSDGSVCIEQCCSYDDKGKSNDGTDTTPSVEDSQIVTVEATKDAIAGVNDSQTVTVDETGKGNAALLLPAGHFYGNDTADKLSGTSGKNVLKGFDGDDVLKGGRGNDKLFGGIGKDVLYGGKGKDAFYFDTAPNKATNVDWIVDFNVKGDVLRFENSVFTELGNEGVLKAAAFWIGSKAHDASDRLIYNSKAGVLYYDPDGTGAAIQIKIATLDEKLALSHRDIFVV